MLLEVELDLLIQEEEVWAMGTRRSVVVTIRHQVRLRWYEIREQTSEYRDSVEAIQMS